MLRCFARLFCQNQKEIIEDYKNKKFLQLQMDYLLNLLGTRIATVADQNHRPIMQSYEKVKNNNINLMLLLYCGRDFQLNEWKNKSIEQANAMHLKLQNVCAALANKIPSNMHDSIDQELMVKFKSVNERKHLLPLT